MSLFQFEVLENDSIPWEQLDAVQDRTIFQTKPWLEFLKASQGVRPIIIEIKQEHTLIGYFSGAVFEIFGIKILGSPFPGWTTAHMGFNLLADIALEPLIAELVIFAFKGLKCWHIEINDKKINFKQIQSNFPKARYRITTGWELDISGPEDCVFKRMSLNRRRCINKAIRNNLIIEQASDIDFVDDYYNQLLDVFRRQGLAPTYPKERVRQLILNLLPTGQLLLVRVREPQTGLCIGSGIFPAFNGTMYFWGGAAFRSQLRHHPNESMHWFAIRYWRERGITRYDMMGGGDYKSRYGGVYTESHWIRISRIGLLMSLRERAEGLIRTLQWLRGKFTKRPTGLQGA